MPLDSLPLVQSDSQDAGILSPGSPGHYRDATLNSGVQLGTDNCDAYAEFHLQRKYDELFGTFYNEDTNTSNTQHLTIYDASNPGNKRSLYGVTLPGLGQAHFRIRVRGVDYVRLERDNGCSGNIDIVATLSIGSLPPTQVVPRFPTGNAGEPANSKVLFGWQPFPHAVNYAFHVWLVGQSGSTTIAKYTPVTFSTLVYHATSYTWDDHGFLPGTYQYALLPLDDKGKALAGWSTPIQITLAS